jgi:NADH-quinone oxidoreductase subunit A
VPESVSQFLRDYLTVGIFALVGLGMGALMVGIAFLIRPRNARPQYSEKYVTYESGVNPIQTGWAQSHIRYYVYALLFVLFDVEAVFIFPWATRLEVYDVFGLVEMFVFIFILLLGLIYAWRKGVLKWD